MCLNQSSSSMHTDTFTEDCVIVTDTGNIAITTHPLLTKMENQETSVLWGGEMPALENVVMNSKEYYLEITTYYFSLMKVNGMTKGQ